MNKIFRTVMLVLFTSVLLAACGQSDEEKQAAADAAAKAAANAPVPLPAAGADDAAWQKYLVSVVTRNMQGVKTNHPFMYYVPAGDSMAAEDALHHIGRGEVGDIATQ